MSAQWKSFLTCLCLTGTLLISASTATAQDPFGAIVEEDPNTTLFAAPTPESYAEEQKSQVPSYAEMKRILHFHQRIQYMNRVETALRHGYHPSRPPGVVTPSMTSRYPSYNTLFIPVYTNYIGR
ncbi:hypothetical protein FF011L_53010 [Roseimaritima multifibrata]|uniref:Uncharacterized protein n=1 Tax=Roseimaritima multifibrata TaxID=1930274 RepID=A0A517MNN7_9BACT|nr:hypothetical protein [Roseimaritima multifibrata]QDS96490.1 hypothetical protein FF011L_53010 [Roseimaritima multifibrata]